MALVLQRLFDAFLIALILVLFCSTPYLQELNANRVNLSFFPDL